MESIYDKVVKITADILKAWTPDPGTVSPFSSSSSQHTETNDNHLEHYVKQNVTTENSDISSMFNSDLFTNGGEKMTEKTLDVNATTTTDNSYANPGAITTEPDSQSAIAITKSAEIPTTTVGTTANTTEEAPSKGETTEPMEKAEDCPDCGKSMTLCECSGMTKAANCPHCGQAMPMTKAADEKETEAEDAKETPEDEAKEKTEMKKSVWGGAFAPRINGKL